MTKNCLQCKNNFDPTHGDRDKFCSQKCYGKNKEHFVKIKRFVIDPRTGCWNWLLAVSHNGYGTMKVKGKSFRAMRYYYELHREKIPEGKVLDHLCSNVVCVNPDHLEIVTVAENTQRGKSAKLNRSIIGRIIDYYKKNNLTQAEIGLLFGIDQSQVSRIIRGIAWV